MQEWSYIPVGGSLPNTEQKNLAFGAAASMVHPATGDEAIYCGACFTCFCGMIPEFCRCSNEIRLLSC